jgi:hypothetical protein
MGATIIRLDVGGHFRTTCRTLRRENFLGLLLRKGPGWCEQRHSSPPGRSGARGEPHIL